MAPTNVLTTGTTAASSTDQVIAAGAKVLYALKDAAGSDGVAHGAFVLVEQKDDAGQYFKVDRLSSRKLSVLLEGPGTFRFTRIANGKSVGVFSG